MIPSVSSDTNGMSKFSANRKTAPITISKIPRPIPISTPPLGPGRACRHSGYGVNRTCAGTTPWWSARRPSSSGTDSARLFRRPGALFDRCFLGRCFLAGRLLRGRFLVGGLLGRRLPASGFRRLCLLTGSSRPVPLDALAERLHQIDDVGIRGLFRLLAEGLRGVQRIALLELGRDELSQLLLVFVTELLGSEVGRHVVDQRSRHLQFLGRYPYIAVETAEISLANLVVPKQRLQHQNLVASAQRAEARLLAQ